MTSVWTILAICLSCSNFVFSDKKPNIVIFIADDLGYGDLGCYGNTTLDTPNIDSLARDGVKLTHHLATASVCTPSRSALMTGRHQMRSGERYRAIMALLLHLSQQELDNHSRFVVRSDQSYFIEYGLAPTSVLRVNFWIASRTGLPPSEITFAELTKKAGYQNALIGKWHLGNNKASYGDRLHHPLNQGFDYFYGLLGTNFDDLANDGSRIVLKQRPYFNYRLLVTWLVITSALVYLKVRKLLNILTFILLFGLTTIACFYPYFIFDNLVLLNSMIHRNHDLVEQPIRHVGLSKRLVQEGLEFMKNSTEAASPFLLVMSFVHVHTALFVSKEFAGSSKHGIYGDAVHEMDWSVGKILEYLDETSQRNNTLVYFVSDHGGHKELGTLGGFNGVYKGGKAHGAPDGGIRVPGLFRWPDVLPAGRITDAPVSMMDIYPLVAKTVGVPIPTDRPIDGQNILPLLQGKVNESPHEFMFHYCGDEIHAARYIPKSGNKVWKYVTHLPAYYPGTDVCKFGCVCSMAEKLDPPHLYDVNDDPSESKPIDPNTQLYKDISKKVQKAIEQHQGSLENPENQFSWQNGLWRYSLQECCKGTFPFNCECIDSKFTPDMYE